MNAAAHGRVTTATTTLIHLPGQVLHEDWHGEKYSLKAAHIYATPLSAAMRSCAKRYAPP